MPSCREIDPLFAPYIDGAATPAEQAAVEAHLRACPKCRHQTALQSVVRDSIRTKLCRPCAPDALRTRCRAAARTGPFRVPRTLISVSIAAALTLVVGGVLLYSPHRVVANGAGRTAHPGPRHLFRRSRIADPRRAVGERSALQARLRHRRARAARVDGGARSRRAATLLLRGRRGRPRDVPARWPAGIALHDRRLESQRTRRPTCSVMMR